MSVSFQKIDPDLSAVTIGAEVVRLGINCFGVEVQGHLLGITDVAAYVAQMWHELGVVDLGANCYGAEL